MAKDAELPTIDLKTFITQALVQLVEGVKDAQDQVRLAGGMINPRNSVIVDGIPRHSNVEYLEGEVEEHGQVVEFDIAVTAALEGKVKGGIAVLGAVIGAGVHGQAQTNQSTASRITDLSLKFRVAFGIG